MKHISSKETVFKCFNTVTVYQNMKFTLMSLQTLKPDILLDVTMKL